MPGGGVPNICSNESFYSGCFFGGGVQGPEKAHKHLAHKQFLGHPGHRSSHQVPGQKMFSVATPAKPRGEKKLFFCAIFGR